ncbi:hypothetical protein EMIT047CA2_140048 [Pseudomonas soli]
MHKAAEPSNTDQTTDRKTALPKPYLKIRDKHLFLVDLYPFHPYHSANLIFKFQHTSLFLKSPKNREQWHPFSGCL